MEIYPPPNKIMTLFQLAPTVKVLAMMRSMKTAGLDKSDEMAFRGGHFTYAPVSTSAHVHTLTSHVDTLLVREEFNVFLPHVYD